VATQRSLKTGSLPWEEEAPAENRFRRVQQASPQTGRNLPGMPLEMDDDADDDLPRRRRRYETESGPWYRPVSKLSRGLLAAGALVILSGFITCSVLLSRFLERDGRFRIAGTEDIQATGLSEVTRAQILPVFGADIGKNVFFIHLADRRKELEQIPWVERAAVMRLLPDQIRVTVKERTPIAFAREGQQIDLVDANGVVLSMSPEAMTKHHYSFPVVTGIDPRDPAASRRARMAVYQRLIGDLDSTGQHYSEQISEIDLTDPEDARVLMPEQGADILAHFGDDQFMARYQRYRAHIAEWRQQYPRLAAVDLRYDNQVVLEMAKGAGAQTAVNAGDGKPVSAADPAQGADSANPDSADRAGSASADHGTRVNPHSGARPSARSAREKRKQAAAKHAAALRHHGTNRPVSRYGQGL